MKICWNGSELNIEFYNSMQRAAMKEAKIAISYMETEEQNKYKERVTQRRKEILDSFALEV